MEGWDRIEDLKAQGEQAGGSWLSVMKSPGLCLDYCSRLRGDPSFIFISLMRADGGSWCCSILWSYHSSPCQLMIKQRKMAGPLSLIAAASLHPSPYFQYWVLEAALARAPLTVVMYNFNVWPRGSSKRNFIKCSLKLKFSWEVLLTYFSCCYDHTALYIFGKFNQLLYCWSDWQIGNIVTSGQEGHTVKLAPITHFQGVLQVMVYIWKFWNIS